MHVVHFSAIKVLPGKTTKVTWAPKGGCEYKKKSPYKVHPLARSSRPAAKRKNACLFQLSESVGGKSARWGIFPRWQNRGITVCCHTPKYPAYRDINRSVGGGETDRQSCGLSGGCVRRASRRTKRTHARARALALTTQPLKMNINRYDHLNEYIRSGVRGKLQPAPVFKDFNGTQTLSLLIMHGGDNSSQTKSLPKGLSPCD